MFVRNMFMQIGYGRELNTIRVPMAEKSSEREQSPSADPQDSLDNSGDIQHEQDRTAVSADSIKAHIEAIRDAFMNPKAPGHLAEKTIPQAETSRDQHSDNLVANRNGTLSFLQDSDAQNHQAGQKSINFAARYGVPSGSPEIPESRPSPASDTSVDHKAAPGEVRKRLDTRAHPEVRKAFDKYLREHQQDLPRLTPEKYEAVSGATDGKDGKPVFNCIANSVRNEKDIIEPKVFMDKFDEFYGEHGFKPIDTLDYSLQEGVEKVVLYGFTPSDGKNYEIRRGAWGPDYENHQSPLCYHAVIQDEDGMFSSKMGSHERIRVADPEDLGGGLYGHPVRVYTRPRR